MRKNIYWKIFNKLFGNCNYYQKCEHFALYYATNTLLVSTLQRASVDACILLIKWIKIIFTTL